MLAICVAFILKSVTSALDARACVRVKQQQAALARLTSRCEVTPGEDNECRVYYATWAAKKLFAEAVCLICDSQITATAWPNMRCCETNRGILTEKWHAKRPQESEAFFGGELVSRGSLNSDALIMIQEEKNIPERSTLPTCWNEAFWAHSWKLGASADEHSGQLRQVYPGFGRELRWTRHR